MVRPHGFGWNAQTAVSNTHQVRPTASADAIHARALSEFDGLRALLTAAGIRVWVLDEPPPPPDTPDAIFPNNWLSTHADGTLVLYPMATENRRAERRPQFLSALRGAGYGRRVVDLTRFEARGQFLEGTGSLVLDRVGRVAYAAQSLRTHPAVVAAFADRLGYRPLIFGTQRQGGQPVYHTNVLLSVGATTAVVCLDVVDPDPVAGQVAGQVVGRSALRAALSAGGRQIVDLSIAQMNQFAGNLLELCGARGDRFWVMSTGAYDALQPDQRRLLARDATLLHTRLDTIEQVGGGGARCMLAELFDRLDGAGVAADTTG